MSYSFLVFQSDINVIVGGFNFVSIPSRLLDIIINFCFYNNNVPRVVQECQARKLVEQTYTFYWILQIIARGYISWSHREYFWEF